MRNKDNSNKETNYYSKLLLKASAFVFVAIVLSKIASYGYKVVIARYFGPEAYGLFNLALIIVTIVASFATIGINEGIFRYVSYYRGKKYFGHIKRLVISSRKIFIFSGIVCTIILAFLSQPIAERIFDNEKLGPLILGMGFAIPFMALSSLYLGVLRGFERVKTYSSLINIYQNTARLGFLVLLIIMGFGFVSISISYVLMFIGLLALSQIYARKDLSSLESEKLPSEKEVIPKVFSYSWPLLFSGLLYNIFYWIDSLFLGYFSNASSVGFYNAAITIVSIFGIAPDIFMQLFFPIVSLKISENKNEIIQKLTTQVTKWIYLLNIPLFLLIFLFPEQWIGALFGHDYLAASQPLRILSIGAIFSSLIWVFSNMISISGKTRLVLKDFISFTLINVILNVLLIPVYGMVGAAFATIITQTLFAITLVTQVKKAYRFNPLRFRVVRLAIIALALIFLGIYLIRHFSTNSILSLFTAIFLIFIYVSLIILLSILDSEDISLLKDILAKIGLRKKDN